jgi:hypothetical protein
MSILKMALILGMDLFNPLEIEDDGLAVQRIRDPFVDVSPGSVSLWPLSCVCPLDKSIVT